MDNMVGLKGHWNFVENECQIKRDNIAQLAMQVNLSHALVTVLYCRGYKTKMQIMEFLFPDEKVFLHDVLLMKNIIVGVDRIKKAIENQEKILICGDYDVDGVTGTSLMLLALRELGARVNFFLPNRVIDGYGLRASTVDKAKLHGYSLLITVDNGTCAFEALHRSLELGIDVIVTDHHQPKKEEFDGFCLINPHQEGCIYPCKYLSGVGVVFKLVSFLYHVFNKSLSPLMYELFMIGTIADLVPLLDENRYLLKKSFNVIDSCGISSALLILKENAALAGDYQLSSTDIGFMIAPQINALGRLDDPRNGVLFFTSYNIEQQKKIGDQFRCLNERRKIEERQASEKLLQSFLSCDIDPRSEGCVVERDVCFHPGIIGLIAAKLNQCYQVPTCVFAERTDSSLLKGSCRTIAACDIFAVLSGIDPAIVVNFGGHRAAAGVTIEKKNFSLFKKQFSDQVLKLCSRSDFELKIIVDSLIDLDDFNIDFYEKLSLLEPFGMNNQAPVFCIMNVVVKMIKIMKNVHVKLLLEDFSQKSVWVIFFNRVDIIEKVKKNMLISCIGKMQKNCWQDKVSIEMLGVDICIMSV